MENIILLWTCDEVNIGVYGSEATMLTEAKLRWILSLKAYNNQYLLILQTYNCYFHMTTVTLY